MFLGYPLAVKLGTITKDGKGDVFSYAEDDMVEDPNLVAHLAHFGIKTSQMEKVRACVCQLLRGYGVVMSQFIFGRTKNFILYFFTL